MTTKRIKDGLLIEYFSNGEVESKENYKNGKLNGKSFYWYENSKKSAEQFFKDGECVESKEWNENGQKSMHLFLKNDKLEGNNTWWHSNGVISEVVTYKNFVLHGHRTKYNDKGQITLFKNYENGNPLDDNQNEFIEPYGDGDIVKVALFLLKGLPTIAIKDCEFTANYDESIDIFSDAGDSLHSLLKYLQQNLWSKYCSYYYGENSNKEPNEDLLEKSKKEVDAFIKILQYRLYQNPKLVHTDLLHNISFTDEELGIDHHRK